MNPAFSAEVIVIGAGAAGLLCAGHAAQRGKRTILLEHQAEIGRKILISGGGRCNFTNLDCGPDNFLSSNPHFAKSALARYTPQDFIALVEKYKIPYHEKKLGQLFCDRSSRDIVRMLEAESKPATIHRKCKIAKIAKAGEFVVETDQGDFRAPVLVIATGGLSIPKIGATAFGYEVAAQFGLKLVRCRPGLVPLTFHEPERNSGATWQG